MDQIFVDNTTLSAVAKCDMRAALQCILGYKTVEESAPLKSGNAAHVSLEVYLKGSSAAEALEAFTAEYAEWAGENVLPDDRLAYENLYKIMEAWYERHPRNKLPWAIDRKLVEIPFAFPLVEDEEIIFTGILDFLPRHPQTGQRWVADHKTTGRISSTWLNKFRLSSQITGYIWAAEQATGEPVGGAYINAIQFNRLPSDPTRKCKEHQVPYAECSSFHMECRIGTASRTPEAINKWWGSAVRLAERYRWLKSIVKSVDDVPKVQTQGEFNDSCMFCSFTDWCICGRKVDLIPTLLRYDPWDPLEGTKYGHKGANTDTKRDVQKNEVLEQVGTEGSSESI